MTDLFSIPHMWYANDRKARPNDPRAWRRPKNAEKSAYSQPWDDQLPEGALEQDASWRTADHRDLVALTLWGLPFTAAIIAALMM